MFATSDLHVGSLGNFASAISYAGQNITILGGGDNHHKANNLQEIIKMTGVSSQSISSPLLNKYTERWYQPTQQAISENYEVLKNNSVLQNIQAFICGFPSRMCQVWLPFKSIKTVIMTVHRYNMDVCAESDWHLWNQQLKDLSSDPANSLAAGSRYDLEYFKYYTDLPVKLVPSFSGT